MPMPATNDIRSPMVLGLSDEDYVAWLDHAQLTIGGSQVGTIMGLNEYATPRSVWARLLSIAPEDDSVTPYIRRGRAMESTVASEYERVTGRVLARCSTLVGRASRALHLQPWMRFSPDRLIRAPSTDVVGGGRRQGRGILEIKVLGRRTFDRTINEGIDLSYYAQLQWYLFGFRRNWGAFAVFNADQWRLHAFDVERDEPFIGEMVARVTSFWDNFVVARVDPEGLNSPLTPTLLTRTPRERGAEAVALDNEADRQLLFRLGVTDVARTHATAEYERAANAVKARMEELGHDAIRGGGIRVLWREGTRRNLDMERLRDHAPRVIDEARLRSLLREWAGGEAAIDVMRDEAGTLADDIIAHATGVFSLDDYYRSSVVRSFRVTHEVERDESAMHTVGAGGDDA